MQQRWFLVLMNLACVMALESGSARCAPLMPSACSLIASSSQPQRSRRPEAGKPSRSSCPLRIPPRSACSLRSASAGTRIDSSCG